MHTLEVMRVPGTAVALTPISHGEIPPEGRETNIIRFRRIPVLKQGLSNEAERIDVPVISGNAVRGLGRRLLFDTMVDALGGRQEVEEYLPSKAADKRMVWYFLRVGGATEKGVKVMSTDYKSYIELQDKIPTLALFGGSFQGHPFESKCRIGFMIAITQETKRFFEDAMGGANSPGWRMIEETAEEFFGGKVFPDSTAFSVTGNIYTGNNSSEIRYSRMKELGIEEGVKEAGIYGVEVMPVGTQFGQLSVLTSDEEPMKLAFRALFSLIQKRGVLGGMSSKGHGMVKIRYLGVEPDKDVKLFVEYCKDHEKEIKDAIKSIPDVLRYTWDSKANNNEEGGENGGKRRGRR